LLGLAEPDVVLVAVDQQDRSMDRLDVEDRTVANIAVRVAPRRRAHAALDVRRVASLPGWPGAVPGADPLGEPTGAIVRCEVAGCGHGDRSTEAVTLTDRPEGGVAAVAVAPKRKPARIERARRLRSSCVHDAEDAVGNSGQRLAGRHRQRQA